MSHSLLSDTIKKSIDIFYKPFGEKKWIRQWGIILIFSLMGLSDIPNSTIIEGAEAIRTLIIFTIAVFKATLINIVLYSSRKIRFISLLLYAATFIYCLLCLINFLSYSLYDFGISTKLMTIIAQTNQREFLEFIPSMWHDIYRNLARPTIWIYILSITAILCVSPSLFRSKATTSTLLATSIVGLVILCYILITFQIGKTTFFVTLRTARNIYQSVEERNTMKALESSKQPFPFADNVKTKNQANNIILIIGESASKDHHSIYGYPLPTTPYLYSLRNELFIFQYAVASGTATAHNIECILSFKSDNDSTITWHDTPWMIDLFNHAGYKTFWLSNQEKSGLWSNTSAVMVSNADVIRYVGAESSGDHTLDRYDSFLIPPFDKALNDSAKNKLICMHLLGSHIIYSKRYPTEFEVITADEIIARNKHKKWMTKDKAKTVAQYDNSIRFTDSILKHLITAASNSPERTVLVYFSDHGENVYDHSDFRGRDRSSVEVPFIIYVNDAYRHSNPEQVKHLEVAQSAKFSTSDVIHMLMTLSGISYPFYDSSKDILSDSFVSRTRYVDDRPWEYDDIKNPGK